MVWLDKPNGDGWWLMAANSTGKKFTDPQNLLMRCVYTEGRFWSTEKAATRWFPIDVGANIKFAMFNNPFERE